MPDHAEDLLEQCKPHHGRSSTSNNPPHIGERNPATSGGRYTQMSILTTRLASPDHERRIYIPTQHEDYDISFSLGTGGDVGFLGLGLQTAKQPSPSRPAQTCTRPQIPLRRHTIVPILHLHPYTHATSSTALPPQRCHPTKPPKRIPNPKPARS